MYPLKARLLRTTLDAMYYTGIYRIFTPLWSGVGAIFTLHRVRSGADAGPFAPNRILDVTPEFLEATISHVLDLGCDIVSLDEARQRLVNRDFGRKFVCFTFDDGYIDHYTTAFPIFRKYNAPFTIYVTTGFTDGQAVFWWQHLEDTIAANEEIGLRVGERDFRMQTRDTDEKCRAFSSIYWELRRAPQAVQQAAVRQLVENYEIDNRGFCDRSALPWEMLEKLAASELVTIGAHTINHYASSKLPAAELRQEAAGSRDILAHRLDVEPAHFAYPFGDRTSAAARDFGVIRELGFGTATTTRKGVLFPEHADHLHALPRVSLNGDYQTQRYIPVFLSGAPFALWNRFRKLDVA
ncbi:MAG: polysaccharide deacetylase family protein [Gammaproteobacteria bacterium]|jgi:peptidoglycan/xylan/chitin deacetylase (PgdA/CDA1 family)